MGRIFLTNNIKMETQSDVPPKAEEQSKS